MLYFATLNDWAWLTPGHPRAAPTSTAKMGIEGLYIRLLGGCREGEDHLILRTRTAARSFHAGRACKPAVRFAPIQFVSIHATEGTIMRCGKWAVLPLILMCATASQGSTQERRLKRADLPAAVQKTADQESQGATVRGYSSEKNGDHLEYEVAMTVRGHNRDVTIAADGAVVEIEEEIALDSL